MRKEATRDTCLYQLIETKKEIADNLIISHLIAPGGFIHVQAHLGAAALQSWL